MSEDRDYHRAVKLRAIADAIDAVEDAARRTRIDGLMTDDKSARLLMNAKARQLSIASGMLGGLLIAVRDSGELSALAYKEAAELLGVPDTDHPTGPT